MGEPVSGYTHPHRAAVWPQAERMQRQAALGIVPAGENLHQHEIETIERLQSMSQIVECLPRDTAAFKPTNDIRWLNNGGIEVELKATSAKYAPIRRLVLGAVRKAHRAGVAKEHFIVDLGPAQLTDKLQNQLAQYNVRRSEDRAITGLWVLAGGELTRIKLE